MSGPDSGASAGNPFGPILARNGYVVLDGGLATALEAAGHRLDSELWSARLLVDAPEAIKAVHLTYLEAGADCITTASYQASIPGFVSMGLDEAAAEALLRRSTDLALEARDVFVARAATGGVSVSTEGAPVVRGPRGGVPTSPLVAASVGPYGAYLADGSEYDGRYDLGVRELDAFHRRRFAVLADSGADLLACETIPSGVEVEVLLALLDEHSTTWAWMSFACGDDHALHDGTPIEDAVRACSGHGRVAAVGVNCTDPALVGELIARAAGATDLPLLVYPNSGEAYDAASGRWSGPRSGWLDGVERAVAKGARVIGGCCRIGPPEISALRAAVEAGNW